MVFLVKYVVKDSSGTIYIAFQDWGQILKIQDCPGDSGTVGAYEYYFSETKVSIPIIMYEEMADSCQLLTSTAVLLK